MIEKQERQLGAIILAAGRGSRIKAKGTNKVALLLVDKPLILHSIHVLEAMRFQAIVVVVGYAKESVKAVLKDSQIIFAEQTKRLGTGHAAKVGVSKLPEEISDVLIIYADDSHFYKEEMIQKLVDAHIASHASLTFLTITVDNPAGLGRIIRDRADEVTAIIEEKDATEKQRKITEVNPACYIFSTTFLRKYLPTLPKSKVTGEYYLTSLIDIALKNKEKITTVHGGKMPWRGVNTEEELAEAELLMRKTK